MGSHSSGDFPTFSRSGYSIQRPRRDAMLSWWLYPKIVYPQNTVTYFRNNQALSELGTEPATESCKSNVLTTTPLSHPRCTVLKNQNSCQWRISICCRRTISERKLKTDKLKRCWVDTRQWHHHLCPSITFRAPQSLFHPSIKCSHPLTITAAYLTVANKYK